MYLSSVSYATSAYATGNTSGSGTFKARIALTISLDWIIDTGATNHMIYNNKLLAQATITENETLHKVYLPNRDTSLVTHTS